MKVVFSLDHLTSSYQHLSRDMKQSAIGVPITVRNEKVGEIVDVHGDMATAELDEDKLSKFDSDVLSVFFSTGKPIGPKTMHPSIESEL